jgi:hypothetical protein
MSIESAADFDAMTRASAVVLKRHGAQSSAL